MSGIQAEIGHVNNYPNRDVEIPIIDIKADKTIGDEYFCATLVVGFVENETELRATTNYAESFRKSGDDSLPIDDLDKLEGLMEAIMERLDALVLTHQKRVMKGKFTEQRLRSILVKLAKEHQVYFKFSKRGYYYYIYVGKKDCPAVAIQINGAKTKFEKELEGLPKYFAHAVLHLEHAERIKVYKDDETFRMSEWEAPPK